MAVHWTLSILDLETKPPELHRKTVQLLVFAQKSVVSCGISLTQASLKSREWSLDSASGHPPLKQLERRIDRLLLRSNFNLAEGRDRLLETVQLNDVVPALKIIERC